MSERREPDLDQVREAMREHDERQEEPPADDDAKRGESPADDEPDDNGS